MVKTLSNLEKAAFDDLKKEGKRILFTREIPLEDSLIPLLIYKSMARPNEVSFMFEVNQDIEHKHFTNLGFNPLATFKCKNNTIEISDLHSKKQLTGNPHQLLRRFMSKYAPSTKAQFPFFADSMFGYMTYDSVRLVETLPDNHPDSSTLPEILFSFFETLLIFDHYNHVLNLILSVDPDTDYQDALERMDALEEKVHQKVDPIPISTVVKEIPINVDLDDKVYQDIITKAKEYVYQGEVFQLVISRTFSMPIKSTPLEIFAHLIRINPSPYMYIYEGEGYSIVGASPEKLVTVFERYVETVAVGGTHPREKDKEVAEVIHALTTDAKEIAEHNMKMEVARNDVAAIAVPGTVVIQELRGTRVFSHVVHMVTRIGGTLLPDKDGIDAITSILPAATLSGSPKLRSMEIIDELENDRRGLYAGGMCLIDCQGNVISCIAIRTIVIKDGMAYVRAGAGAVIYSDPAYESRESRHKAQGSFLALKLAEGGHP